jgi:glycosyltransferase involved in cell wall biosynthesis
MPNLILISDADASFIRQSCTKSKIWVVSNGVDTEYFRPSPNASPRRADILFTGVMDYWPNEEAMLYFMRTILPRIRKEMPDVKLVVAGRNPPASLRDLAQSIEGVLLTGFLEDLRPSFEHAAAYVAPIRSGAGMKNKILEAWAMGAPVVATTEACRGIEVEDGGNVLIADHPDDFTAKTVRLLREPELGERLRRAARARVEERYSWRSRGQGLAQICREIVDSRTLR